MEVEVVARDWLAYIMHSGRSIIMRWLPPTLERGPLISRKGIVRPRKAWHSTKLYLAVCCPEKASARYNLIQHFSLPEPEKTEKEKLESTQG